MSALPKRLICALALAQSLLCAQLFPQESAAPAIEDRTSAAGGSDEASQKYGLIQRLNSGVTPPVLIHTVAPQFSEEARKKKMGGMVLLDLIVDKSGQPQNMRVVCAPGMGLDIKAIAAVSEYRFKPAMRNGVPVEVELQVRVDFQVSRNKKKEAKAEALARQQPPEASASVPSCESGQASQTTLTQSPGGAVQASEPSGSTPSSMASASIAAEAADEAKFGPIKKVGNGVSVPTVTHMAHPEFTEEARNAAFNGAVLIGLIVDRQGIPQSVHVIRGVGMGLDEQALAAVRQYRFKPAMENGQPVAVRLNVEVNFQTFQKPQSLGGLSAPPPGDLRDASHP